MAYATCLSWYNNNKKKQQAKLGCQCSTQTRQALAGAQEDQQQQQEEEEEKDVAPMYAWLSEVRCPRMSSDRILALWTLTLHGLLATINPELGAGKESACSIVIHDLTHGHISSKELPHRNALNCVWTVLNPDPAVYSIFLRATTANAKICNSISVKVNSLDYNQQKDNQTAHGADYGDVMELCDSESYKHPLFTWWDYKHSVQVRIGISQAGPSRHWKTLTPASVKKMWSTLDRNGEAVVEIVFLNTVQPNESSCRVICDWLEGCLASGGAQWECTVGQVPCKCQPVEIPSASDRLPCETPAGHRDIGCSYYESDSPLPDPFAVNMEEAGWSAWSPWSPCSRTCSGGVQLRIRTCLPSARPGSAPSFCPGNDEQGRECNKHKCHSVAGAGVAGAGEEWSEWSVCSSSCGEGSQVRARVCLASSKSAACSGPLREIRVCDSSSVCPVHGVWGEWSPWSLCSYTCGRGLRTRMRHCSVPQHGGSSCEGPYNQTKVCNIALCPVDGQWADWSKWSACSVTCENGTQQRSRECVGPIYGGTECVGAGTENRRCDNNLCPVDGRWGVWAAWGECSATCDGGLRWRQRKCWGPFHGGRLCQGGDKEPANCTNPRCPEPYEMCAEEVSASILWKETEAQSVAVSRCPPDATVSFDYFAGVVRRKCSLSENGTALWEYPSFSKCISLELQTVLQSLRYHRSKRLWAPSLADGLSQTSRELAEASQGQVLYGGDVLASLDILRNVSDTFRRAPFQPSSDDIQNVLQSYSNLVADVHREHWEDTSEIYSAISNFMDMLEGFLHMIGEGMKYYYDSYFVKENLVVGVSKLSAADVAGDVVFPVKGRRGMPDWVRASNDRVLISRSSFARASAAESPVFVVGIVIYKHLETFLPKPRNNTIVQSRIISVSMNPAPDVVRLELDFSHTANGTNSYCAFWDPVNIGWSGAGCKTMFSDAFRTKCRCEHFSSFTILAQPGFKTKINRSRSLSLTLIVGCSFSSLALILLMIVHFTFWRSVKSDRSLLLFNFCISIISSNILILIGETQTYNKVTCTVVAVFLHFFFLASFCWVLTEAWQSFMAVRGVSMKRIVRKRFLCLGWGLPALVVASSVGFTKSNGYGTIHYCWLSLEGGLLYSFVGPAAVVVLVNMILGIVVFNKLVAKDGIADKALKHRAGASLWSSCVVLPLLALTWMCAVLAITDPRSFLFPVLFCVFNSLQGLVIFVVNCILKKETEFEKDIDLTCQSVSGTLSRAEKNREKSHHSKQASLPESALTVISGKETAVYPAASKKSRQRRHREGTGSARSIWRHIHRYPTDKDVSSGGEVQLSQMPTADPQCSSSSATFMQQHLQAGQQHTSTSPMDRSTHQQMLTVEAESIARSPDRQKSKYSEIDIQRIMHTRQRHSEMFQEMNQKFQSLERKRKNPDDSIDVV
ncbi:adhesion G protein-coupled receptor B1-like isoform X6 [Lethenteron reissneri]|uniref:adhesion G protein-coupled receptor B1-like isoform X6 n=1 Tax=Lethenteron reissneri TaxID=7753 RepID=UPI002AB73583|nr:adhesion G protein-coupled receptor B1-like isoform X6 [Lethenteron reissneri]